VTRAQRARRRVGALGAGLGLTALLVVPGSAASASDDAEKLIEQARKVSTEVSFAGVVEVRWVDESGSHRESVTARSVRGAFVVAPGAEQVIGRGELRWAGDPNRGGSGWRADMGRDVPGPGASWDLEVGDDATVAGRAATFVEARDGDGDVRARFAIDRETGQLLEREILDRDGKVVRSVGFTTIVATELPPLVPTIPPSDVSVPTAIREVPDGYVAPDTVAHGYRLLGRYQRADGVVQLYYGDGLFSVSVFEQSGFVDWDALPESGRDSRIDGVRTHSYRTAEGSVVVWGDRGLVLTGIADGPPGTAASVVAAISGDDDSTLPDDIADFILDPFTWD